MRIDRLVFAGWLTVLGAATPPVHGELPCFTRRASWAETLVATRTQYGQWAATHPAPVALGDWYQTGPVPNRDAGQGAPQHPGRINLKARNDSGARLWRRVSYADGDIHRLKAKPAGSIYLVRNLTTSRAVNLKASLRAAGFRAAWLNGRTLSTGTGRDLTLSLKAGVNELLLEIRTDPQGRDFLFTSGQVTSADLWRCCVRDFPRESAWMEQDLGPDGAAAWFARGNDPQADRRLVTAALRGTGTYGAALRRDCDALDAAGQSGADTTAWLRLYGRACVLRERLAVIHGAEIESLRLAVTDLRKTHGAAYPQRYVEAVAALAQRAQRNLDALARGERLPATEIEACKHDLETLRRRALLANPLLDMDRILVIRRHLGNKARRAMSRDIGLPSLNSHNNTSIANPATGWDNEIALLTDLRGDTQMHGVYRPAARKLITDVDLHFDGRRVLFSMPGSHDHWQIFEMDVTGRGLHQLTPTDLPDVDHFDSCYLPNDDILFTSTANFQGLPCEGGSRPMAPLYLLHRPDGRIRQLTYEQDSDWCPTVLNDGRVLYLRWEYSDLPHYFARILFHMNPDGTQQAEYYGSGSYWPNALFYARPLPGHPTRVIGVVGGHHGLSRSGRLVIFDPAQGRHEADGVVQEIPGRGRRVEPIIRDRLVDGVWPQFLHPYPLSDKVFVVAAKPTPEALWGIYLVDVFDNMTCIAEEEGTALLEPLPVRARPRPPVIPDKVDLTQTEATIFLTDVYRGPGLRGIPRGTVKRLRLFSYHFAHVKSGGHASVGVESSWDIKRILGTVPVEADGSALFRVPANTPISVQPLDDQGRALQLMRSWFVGMPGEVVSCVGCHEPQNTTAPSLKTLAATRPASTITRWQGPARPFAFALEVEPVLDRYCVACHDGRHADRPNFTDRRRAGAFDETYMALHPYTRRPGPESDIHVLQPMEYHASTSELVQMLEAGHHGVQLDPQAWEVLTTWIDLNVPFRGKWNPPVWQGVDQDARRRELACRYANRRDDPEGEYDARAQQVARRGPIEPLRPPRPAVTPAARPTLSKGPQVRHADRPTPACLVLDPGAGPALELLRIPAGRFVMGGTKGPANESPAAVVTIDTPFWMGTLEVTNAQYRAFDPEHDSRFIDQQWKDHTLPGYPANEPDQPVIRVSWQEALAYCRWLSERTGRRVTLPTEAQWEWACRAGTDSPFFYGDQDSDFSPFANLADASIQLLAVKGVNPQPVANPDRFVDFVPRDARFSDGAKIVAPVGSYRPNAWGLYDMHGNVAEWTRSRFTSYPYVATDGRNALDAPGRRVVRGGSWRSRPARARAAFRWGYEAYQRVYDVGFRVIVTPAHAEVLAAATRGKDTQAQ